MGTGGKLGMFAEMSSMALLLAKPQTRIHLWEQLKRRDRERNILLPTM